MVERLITVVKKYFKKKLRWLKNYIINCCVGIPFWVVLIGLILFTLLGSARILLYSGGPLEVLSSFGSFVGGMFTILAVLIAVHEFITFKRVQGLQEFRNFFRECVVELGGMVFNEVDSALIIYNKAVKLTQLDDNDEFVAKRAKDYGAQLNEIAKGLSDHAWHLESGSNEIAFYNPYLYDQISNDVCRLVDMCKMLSEGVSEFEAVTNNIRDMTSLRNSEITHTFFKVDENNELTKFAKNNDYSSWGSLQMRRIKLITDKDFPSIKEFYDIVNDLNKIKVQ
ncbi:MAG: hypothetical protein ACI85L_000381 [Pseudomonadota bacterium]